MGKNKRGKQDGTGPHKDGHSGKKSGHKRGKCK
jgi:hypothetical protein